PVPADVVERAGRVVLAADDEKALVADRLEEEVAGLRDLLRPARAEPAVVEDVLDLLPVDLVGLVIRSGEAAGKDRHRFRLLFCSDPNYRNGGTSTGKPTRMKNRAKA